MTTQSQTGPVLLGQAPVTLDELKAVARGGRAVGLADAARDAMRVSTDWVADLSERMDRGEATQAIYSINTGFGSLSGRQPPQDAYSLRCVPQVLGPVRDTLRFVRGIVETEINAATDNPLIFADRLPARSLKAVSGGNFHAEYVAFAADFLSIVVTEIGNIAERRLFRLNDGTLNRGLPDMLVASEHVGMDCGYMLPQYLAAALVSDCKTLAHPDSVDSIPTCSNQEDHVSMANNAGRHARQVVRNIENVVGIEVLMAAQALELRLAERGLGKEALSPATRAVLDLLRGAAATDGRPIDHLERDVVLYPRLHAVTELVHSGAVLAAARTAMA